MQAPVKRIDFHDRTLVQDAKISRLMPGYYSNPRPNYHRNAHIDSEERYDDKKHSKRQHPIYSDTFNFTKIWDFLKSEEALILLVIFLLISEGNMDILLIAALGYILLFDDNFMNLLSLHKCFASHFFN